MDNQVKDAFVRIKSCTFAFMKRTFLISYPYLLLFFRTGTTENGTEAPPEGGTCTGRRWC